MIPNIPETRLKRVVIVGAGFGGLELAQQLEGLPFQVVLIDKNNYHQFQPLFYQVATAGLEPSSISFPLRRVFRDNPNFVLRITEFYEVEPETRIIRTGLGPISYDYLVFAMGADTNYFGLKGVAENAIPMKSVSEALALRNTLLQNFEDAITADTDDELEGLLNVVVAGGGPTGVEISGTLAEMRKTVLPKDHPEIDFGQMHVTIVEAGPNLLGPMAPASQQKSREFLEEMGVTVRTGTQVKDYDGRHVTFSDGTKIRSNTLIWAAGVKAIDIKGLPAEAKGRGGRLLTDPYNRLRSHPDIYAIGDIALTTEEKYPDGHPQVAQPAIQMARNLARNFKAMAKGKVLKPFRYKDLGSMATIGKNKAVAEIAGFKFQGFFAWAVWMFVHLISIFGVRNRVSVFFTWAWSYITSDQNLRLILSPKKPAKPKERTGFSFEAISKAARKAESV